jgi:hypothetical protein
MTDISPFFIREEAIASFIGLRKGGEGIQNSKSKIEKCNLKFKIEIF